MGYEPTLQEIVFEVGDYVGKFVLVVDDKVGFVFVSVGVLLAAVQDTFGAGPSGALEIEQISANDDGLLRWDIELLADMQDGKGMGLGGSVIARTNAVKDQIMNAADPLYAVESVAGYNPESSVLVF